VTGLEVAIATQVSKRAWLVIKSALQGGDVGRLIHAVASTLADTTGLSATTLSPLRDDEAFLTALASYFRTGRFPREEMILAIEPFVGPLSPELPPRESAETVAAAIETMAHRAFQTDREAMHFEFSRVHEALVSGLNGASRSAEVEGVPQWRPHLQTIDYANVPRLLLEPGVDLSFDPRALGALESIDHLAGNMPGYLIAINLIKQASAGWFVRAIDVGDFKALRERHERELVSFAASFRTKNVPGLYELRHGWEMPQTQNELPHVYVKAGKRRVVLWIDPRWLTTSTAFVHLSSGWAKLAGLAIVRSVTATTVTATPLIFGLPHNPWSLALDARV
jgi:hypothetical protein